MQLNRLLVSKPLFKNLTRHIIFISIINVICTFLLLPFSYVLSRITNSNFYEGSKYLVGYSSGPLSLYIFGTMAFSVIAGIMLTYYLKSENASDFIHSLPIKRPDVMTTTIAAFIVQLVLNLVLNGVALLFLMPFFHSITPLKIFNWILLSLIVAVFVFAVTLVIGLLVNNVISHLVFTVFILLLPLIVNTIYYSLINIVYTGLQDFNEERYLQLTVPVNVMTKIMESHFDYLYFGIVFLVSVALIVSSYFIYNKRRNENINDGYANKPAEYILFTLLVTIGTLFAGAAAIAIFPKNIIFLIVIFTISFCLLYYLMEMIAQKSVRITINRLLFFISLIVAALSIIFILISGKYQESYVPALNEVESASITNSYNSSGQSNDLFSSGVKDKEYINDIIGVHQSLAGKNDDSTMAYVTISYHLKNGKEITRGYNVNDMDARKVDEIINKEHNVNARIKTINWEAFKKRNIRIERYNYEGTETLQLERRLNDNEKTQLAAALEKDVIQLKGEDALLTKSATQITLSDGNGPFFYLTPYHVNTIQLLKQLNIIDKVSDLYGEQDFSLVNETIDYDKLAELDLYMVKKKKADSKQIRKLLDEGKANISQGKWYLYDAVNSPTLIRIQE